MNNDYKPSAKLSAEEMRKRQREYWRRWKERNSPKTVEQYGWNARFKKDLQGWGWTARNERTGAILENGYFNTLSMAKLDFFEAIK